MHKYAQNMEYIPHEWEYSKKIYLIFIHPSKKSHAQWTKQDKTYPSVNSSLHSIPVQNIQFAIFLIPVILKIKEEELVTSYKSNNSYQGIV